MRLYMGNSHSPASPSNAFPFRVQQVWNGREGGCNRGKYGCRVMVSEVFVHRYGYDDHAASNDVANERECDQGRGGISCEGLNDIHVDG